VARHKVQLVRSAGALLAVAISCCYTHQLALASAQETLGAGTVSATFSTVAVGNIAFDVIQIMSSNDLRRATYPAPTRRSRSCYYSDWHLISVNAVSRERKYGVFIYNGCFGDTPVFPTPADPRVGPCNNDDSRHASALYSLCPVLQPGHVPAGVSPDRCDALEAATTALNADLVPPTYDPSQDTRLTATTSFASDVAKQLAEGTCLANLGWQDIGWSMRWSDGAVDRRPGSGQQGITDSHVLSAQPADAGGGSRRADVTAVATLHVTGDGVDFDDSGAPVVVHRSADVQVSNHRSATGMAPGAVDTPPQLAVGALAVGQRGDGSVGSAPPSAAPEAHANTIRGRLLELFPRAIVLRPGDERVDGALVGEGRSEVVTWTYLGGLTDAPPREATPPGATGPPEQPIRLQWNHAERLDAQRQPVDEEVPLRLLVRTTYPDGHVDEQTVLGVIRVSIYYVGLREEE
jgi:hypothetical protein